MYSKSTAVVTIRNRAINETFSDRESVEYSFAVDRRAVSRAFERAWGRKEEKEDVKK